MLFGKIPLALPVAYPLLPWPGVMAVGYSFGSVMRKPVADSVKLPAVSVVNVLAAELVMALA